MRRLSVRENMLWNSAGSLLYSGCQWLITVMVVRLSSSYEAAGVLAVSMAVSNIFAPIALYRIRSYQVSDVHEQTSSGEYVALRLVTIGAGLAVTMLYAVATCAPSSLPSVFLYLLFRAGDVFIDVFHGIDQQHYRMDYCGRSMGMRAILFLAAFCLVMSATDSLELAILAMIVATYPVIIYDVWCARQFAPVRPTFSARSIKELLVTCLPAVVGIAACNLVVTFARQYLSTVAGEGALGIYASVCTPVVLIQACANYVYAPLLGVFAERLDQGDASGFRTLLARVCAALFGIFGLGALAFFFVGDWFLGVVFGEGVAAYGYLMYAGILCSALTACVAFLGDLLVAMRDMRDNLVGNVAACVVSVPATLLLVNAFGMNGVSFAISVSYLVGIAIMARGALQSLGRATSVSSS